jgi:hypothetical protein
MFTLRGELMHCFVSYRVATEGIFLTLHQQESSALLHSRPLRAPAAHRAPLTARPDGCAGPDGNGLAERVAAKIRSISTDTSKHGLPIPRHGW